MAALEHSQPDLVLLDIQMPGLDGCKTCREIKSRPETRDIPVMLVSGLAEAQDLAETAGADDFLIKPFNLDDLYDRVETLLRAKASTPNPAWSCTPNGAAAIQAA